MLAHREGRTDPVAADGLVGDSRPAGILAVVVVGCGHGYRSLDAVVGTGPVEGSLVEGRRGVLGCRQVVVGHMDLDVVWGNHLVAAVGSSPAAAEDSPLGADLRRPAGLEVDCSFAGIRRRRRRRSSRRLTFCGRVRSIENVR